MTEAKVSPRCSECGSNDIVIDAYVWWNNAAQSWVLGEIYDSEIHCNKCGADFDADSVQWVEIPDTGEAS